MNSHKDWVRTTFDRASLQYGEKGCSFFDYFGKQLVKFASPKQGEAILDVATGKGAVLFPAAKVVGQSGVAVGIDISSEMIQEAKKRMPFPWIKLQQMDAEGLDFADESFDCVFCGFCLFFLPNLFQALSEFKRVLKPSGRLAVSVWGERSSIDEWFVKQFQKRGITQKLSIQNLHSEHNLKAALHEAGFMSIKTSKESKSFWHENAEAWWESLWSHGTRALLEQLSPSDQALVKQEVLAHLGTVEVADARNAIFAIGHKGSS